MIPQRIPHSPSHQSDFGLVAWLEETRIALPLKGVECRFDVTGSVASVELDQVYHQNARKPLDCTYTFPLPAGAVVHRCEVHINGRIIRAKVEEEGAAWQMYQAQKAAGRRVALVETVRENVFTLSLGNVQPGDVVVVCFAWFQVLDRLDAGLRLMVPTCPGIRYIPGKPLLRASSGRGTADDTDQVPDASRLTPPRIDALHPDAAYFCITGRLSASDVESGTASSPSHSLLVRETEGRVGIELSGRGDIPDRDFVLTWKEPAVLQLAPQAWHWREGVETYALVQLRAPADVKVADGLSQDFYFLVDRSGSMEGAKWHRTCEALRGFVGLLGAADRVWITLFESTFQDFDAAPMSAPRVLADVGFQKLVNLGVAGGTELLPAAKHVLEKIAAHSAGRRASVILITDGQVGNDGAILQAFKTAANATVHTFGIDTTVNDAFLKSLARQQRGGCWLQTPNDDIAGTVSALGDRLRRPVLRNLAAKGGWEIGDGILPDLHAKEVATVALRGRGTENIEVIGSLPDGTAHSFHVGIGAAGSEAVKLLWAEQRIGALLASGKQQEAIALAKLHNLICEGAAFIAWDEQEQVAVAKEEIIQPAMAPDFQAKHSSSHKIARCVGRAKFFNSDVLFRSCAPSIREPLCVPLRRPAQETGLFRRILGALIRPGETAKKRILVDQTIAKLWEVMEREQVSQLDADRFAAWVENGDQVQRAEALIDVMNLIEEVRDAFGSRGPLEQGIERLLGRSPEALTHWMTKLRPNLDDLIRIQPVIDDSEISRELSDRILALAVESGGFDKTRIKSILTCVLSPGNASASASEKERQTRELIEHLTLATAP